MSKNQKSRKPQSLKMINPNPVTVVNEPSPALSTARVSYSQSFNPDYSNVIKDLKRIGMLAGIFFVIIIILSFIL